MKARPKASRATPRYPSTSLVAPVKASCFPATAAAGVAPGVAPGASSVRPSTSAFGVVPGVTTLEFPPQLLTQPLPQLVVQPSHGWVVQPAPGIVIDGVAQFPLWAG